MPVLRQYIERADHHHRNTNRKIRYNDPCHWWLHSSLSHVAAGIRIWRLGPSSHAILGAIRVPSNDRAQARSGAGSQRRLGESPHRVLGKGAFCRSTYRPAIPKVEAEKKILMVGDSVLFDVGVDDEDTIASNPQRLVGDSHRVVIAGVGGYGGVQIFALARVPSDRKDFEILVYLGHHHDFYEPSDKWHDQQRDRHCGARNPSTVSLSRSIRRRARATRSGNASGWACGS